MFFNLLTLSIRYLPTICRKARQIRTFLFVFHSFRHNSPTTLHTTLPKTTALNSSASCCSKVCSSQPKFEPASSQYITWIVVASYLPSNQIHAGLSCILSNTRCSTFSRPNPSVGSPYVWCMAHSLAFSIPQSSRANERHCLPRPTDHTSDVRQSTLQTPESHACSLHWPLSLINQLRLPTHRHVILMPIMTRAMFFIRRALEFFWRSLFGWSCNLSGTLYHFKDRQTSWMCVGPTARNYKSRSLSACITPSNMAQNFTSASRAGRMGPQFGSIKRRCRACW